jgi:hypothetical protein
VEVEVAMTVAKAKWGQTQIRLDAPAEMEVREGESKESVGHKFSSFETEDACDVPTQISASPQAWESRRWPSAGVE